MKQRLLVRRRNDMGHVYCLVTKGMRDEVFKIGLMQTTDTNDRAGQIHAISIWDSPTSKLVILEPDPENSERLFVLDEEQRITTLEDSLKSAVEKSSQANKANVVRSSDMTKHSMEEDLLHLKQMPFESIVISQRMIKIGISSMSQYSTLSWFDERA